MADDFSFEQFETEEKKVNPKDSKNVAAPEYTNDAMQVSRRVKVLEEGLSNLRKKILIDEQNDINRHKKELVEHKTTINEVNDIKKEIENIKRVIKEVISELQGCARHEEVDVLKKYINIWDPIKFVTEETVEKMIDEKLEDSNNKD
jgi:hypothetical protein